MKKECELVEPRSGGLTLARRFNAWKRYWAMILVAWATTEVISIVARATKIYRLLIDRALKRTAKLKLPLRGNTRLKHAAKLKSPLRGNTRLGVEMPG